MSLEGKSRKEIQAIAKEHGLKANKATDVLIKEILVLTSSAHDEENTDTNNKGPEDVIDSTQSAAEISESVADVKKRRISIDNDEWDIGNHVLLPDGTCGVIMRLNKKSARVQILGSSKEVTMKFEELTRKNISDISAAYHDETDHFYQISLIKDQIAQLIPMDVQMDTSFDTIDNKFGDAQEIAPASEKKISTAGPFSHSHVLSNIIANTRSMFSPSPARMTKTSFKSLGTPTRKSSCKKAVATPSSLKKPAIVPSSTKSQILRQEASLLKKRNFEEIQKQAQQEVDDFLVSSSITKTLAAGNASIDKRSSNVSIRPSKTSSSLRKSTEVRKSVSASSGLYKSRPAPNFSLEHAKQFSKQKSITNIVPRDEKLNEKMTIALKTKLNTQQNPKISTSEQNNKAVAFSLGPFNHKENIPKKFVKVPESEASAPAGFKAKPMPNFQKMHTKLTLNAGNESSKSCNGIPKNLVSSKKSSFCF